MASKAPTKVTKTASVEHWAAVCKSKIRQKGVKLAANIGDDSTSFEAAFSNLAHSVAQEKCPQMQQYELGFNLVEKSDDNDKAIGVTGYMIDKNLYLAPVFFLNGQIKGTELLYDKNRDIFLPFKENWLNEVIRKKTRSMGDATPKHTRALGVEYPILSAYSEIPGKYASAISPWLAEGLPGLAHTALAGFKSPGLMLPNLIKTSSYHANRLLQFAESFPAIARPLIECYGEELFKVAMRTARTKDSIANWVKQANADKKRTTGSIFATVTKEAAVRKNGTLKIWLYNGSPVAGLTEKQATALKQAGILVEDKRAEASKLYTVQQPVKLTNPLETGIYEVLVKPGDFEKCVVFTGTMTGSGVVPGILLVRAESKSSTKRYEQAKSSDIFITGVQEGKELGDWIDKLPKATSLKKDSTCVLITSNGQASQPFRVSGDLSAVDGQQAYRVYWQDDCGCCCPFIGGGAEEILKVKPRRSFDYRQETDMVVIGATPSNKLLSISGTLYAPKDVKVLVLDKSEPEAVEDEAEEPIRPGTMTDFNIGLYKNASELKIFADDYETVVGDRRMQPMAALVHLVRDYGLREKTAREAIKIARKNHGARFLIKKADQTSPYDLQNSAPSAPMVPEPSYGSDDLFQSGMPVTNPTNYNVPITGLSTMRPGQMNMAAPPDGQMMQQVMEAAQSGQKEVLDASMLTGLLKGTQDYTVIDKDTAVLIKGLDSLCRLYFSFLWHQEMFENRYGADKLPEMEDALRNNIDSFGDLVLDLRRKAVEPYPGEDAEVKMEENAEV